MSNDHMSSKMTIGLRMEGSDLPNSSTFHRALIDRTFTLTLHSSSSIETQAKAQLPCKTEDVVGKILSSRLSALLATSRHNRQLMPLLSDIMHSS